ncbi:hypothetical protein N2152v2_003746 [Parachlorella kessleri]
MQNQKKGLAVPGKDPGPPRLESLKSSTSVASATSSPRRPNKANSRGNAPGGGTAAQLSAAERVRLRQQAAAMGAVERLKHRKVFGLPTGQERAAQAGSSHDSIAAGQAGEHGASLPHMSRSHPHALSPSTCFSYESGRSSGMGNISSSPSFYTEDEDEGLAQTAQDRSPVPVAAARMSGAADGLHQQPSFLLNKPSLSRRQSLSKSHSAVLDESDMPLATLAALNNSRRATMNSDGAAEQARPTGAAPRQSLCAEQQVPQQHAPQQQQQVPQHNMSIGISQEAEQCLNGATAASPAPSVAEPHGKDRQMVMDMRGPSRIQSLMGQRQRDRTRLSLNGGLMQQGSPGMLRHLASDRSSGAEAANEAPDDALASFGSAVRQQRRFTDAGPLALVEGSEPWRRRSSTPSSRSPSSLAPLGIVPCGELPPAEHRSIAVDGVVIPRCPSGRMLQLVIHSTWGDTHYVGLAAVELFDASGRGVTIRHVEVLLDGILVFSGEFQQASGTVADALQHAECILFTDDLAALERIEAQDTMHMAAVLEASRASPPGVVNGTGESLGSSSYRRQHGAAAASDLDLVTAAWSPRAKVPAEPMRLPQIVALQHPSTGQPSFGHGQLCRTVTGGRPLTAATSLMTEQGQLRGMQSVRDGDDETAGQLLVCCKQLTLVLVDTHGDSHFVGLTGLEIVGAAGGPVPVTASSLWADPSDLNVFPGHSGDVRTVDKLVDGENVTMDDTHGIPDSLKDYNVLVITLGEEPVPVLGLRFWNYNKSPADTTRGLKRCIVLADGVEVSPPGGVLVRKAPGTAAFDFGQLIPLSTQWVQQQHHDQQQHLQLQADLSSANLPGSPAASRRSTMQGGHNRLNQPVVKQGHGGTGGPVARVWDEGTAWVCNMPKPLAAAEYLHRVAAWRKNNTLHQPTESFATPLPCGFALKLVILTSWGDPHYVGLVGLEVLDAARVPSSVSQLPGMASDVRTPDKLVDDEGNSIYINYDEPILLGAIRVWNYAKTPTRGVQELEVYLDDQLVYKGLLQKAPDTIAPGADFSQTLCFSEDSVQADMRQRVAQTKLGLRPGVDSVADLLSHDYTVLVNDGQFVRLGSGGSGRQGEQAAALRPTTAAVC